MIHLHIDEEYGYQEWEAQLTEDEFAECMRKWNTMRNLNCLVPVRLLFPTALPISLEQMVVTKFTHKCHMHESDDSYLHGTDYVIPDVSGENFSLDGKEYTDDELVNMTQEMARKYGIKFNNLPE
jgi:hypothetical protein